MLGVKKEKFIVSPPERKDIQVVAGNIRLPCFTFFYASTPDCHKNFELLCAAASLLERETGAGKFKVVLTVSGKENSYAQCLYKKYGEVDSIDFAGFMSK